MKEGLVIPVHAAAALLRIEAAHSSRNGTRKKTSRYFITTCSTSPCRCAACRTGKPSILQSGMTKSRIFERHQRSPPAVEAELGAHPLQPLAQVALDKVRGVVDVGRRWKRVAAALSAAAPELIMVSHHLQETNGRIYHDVVGVRVYPAYTEEKEVQNITCLCYAAAHRHISHVVAESRVCWGSGGVSGSGPATHRVGVPSKLAAKHVPDAIVVLICGAAVVDDNVRQHLHPRALQPPHAPEKAGGNIEKVGQEISPQR